jgi:hypothetical protein
MSEKSALGGYDVGSFMMMKALIARVRGNLNKNNIDSKNFDF